MRRNAKVTAGAIRVGSCFVSVLMLFPEICRKFTTLAVQWRLGIGLPFQPALAESMPIAGVQRPTLRVGVAEDPAEGHEADQLQKTEN